jgi:hypothetical protein
MSPNLTGNIANASGLVHRHKLVSTPCKNSRDHSVLKNMLTGQLRGQIDAIWNPFWTGDISNPLEVTEQLTYLLLLQSSRR